jgi:uncharacterized protein DUF5686/carboxypeptidase family protein
VPRIRACACLALGLAAAGPAGAQQGVAAAPTVTLVGAVFDTISGRPLRLAVVRVAQTGATTLTDDAGRYRVSAPPGDVQIVVRRIAYEPAAVTVTATGALTRRNIYLRPIAIGLAPVVVSARDEFAREVMRRAIARKHQLFSKLHDYRYDAYLKFVLRDITKPQELAESVLMITETRTSVYWEPPDHRQETILARRQSRNLDPKLNLLSAGANEIANFTRPRIDVLKYSLVSPIADDAFDHYDYRVLDTLVVDGRRVFRLAIQPTSASSPLFVGVIDIADSTYDVLGIDVGANEAVRISFVDNVRYQQRLKDVGGGRWMPYEIRLSFQVHFAVPLPGVPERMPIEYVASLDNFRFDQGHRPPNLGEVQMVVHDRADRADSAIWAAPGAVSITPAERAAWTRIDSVERLPPAFSDRMLQGLVGAARLSTNADFFHFNRVDGPAVGAGRTWLNIPGVVLRTKLDYTTGSDTWQYRFGGRVRVADARRLWLGGAVFDETANREALVSRDYNPTYRALFFRLDPLDYYRQRGWNATLSTKLVNFTRLSLKYTDVRQSSLSVVTDYSLFSTDRAQRLNPLITDGRLRSVLGTLTYDSRPLLQEAGQAFYLQTLTRTRVVWDVEAASPGLISNDFDFRRYSLLLDRQQRTLNLGLTTIMAEGGIATGHVPPQRYFVVDFGMRTLTFQGSGFNTMRETSFAGTRAAMIALRHDFDRLLFAKSGIPLVRDLPITLSIHGGAFWTDFKNQPSVTGDSIAHTGSTPYSELGFGLGNLTPFLSPFNIAAYFTWQLSSYPTSRWVFGFGFTRL